jgi:hypothetical protein
MTTWIHYILIKESFYFEMLQRTAKQQGCDYWVAKLNNWEQSNKLIKGFISFLKYWGIAVGTKLKVTFVIEILRQKL